MKKRNKQIGMIVAVVALLVTVMPNVQADEKHYEGWVRSFAEAKELAAKEGKSILMEFTGSDWCQPCKALHKNVLGTDAFKNEITKDFILLVLDNPRDKTLVSDAEQEQYKKLSAQYKVTGVPTVFLADAEGKPYHKQVGYGGDPAEKWVANARGKVKVLAQRDEFFAQASEAKGIERAKLLEKAISEIDQAIRLSLYGDTVSEIVSLDAENTAGLKSKYEGLQQAEQFKGKLAEIRSTSRAKQPEEVIAAIDELIKTAKPTGAALQEAVFFKSAVLFGSGDKDGAKALLLQAQKLAPNTATGQRIPNIIEANFK
ncbi:MAG: thioredoxin family protein [Planctomycetaceae bacterium]|nr:thioredoxin family protein [Planctomycetaceae bacterium]